MDTQDIALMVVIGILVVALVVVNTSPLGQVEESVGVQPIAVPTKIPLRSSVTTMVTVYNPIASTKTMVDVI